MDRHPFLAAALCLTIAGVGQGVLVLPASATGYSWVDTGSSDWFLPTNWAPYAPPLYVPPPGEGDVATILVPDQIILTASTAEVDRLNVSAGAEIRTNGHLLIASTPAVDATTYISGSDGPGLPSRIVVEPGGLARGFDTDRLYVLDGGQLAMSGGVAHLDDSMFVDETSSLIGHGTVVFTDVNDDDLVQFRLEGTMRPSGGTLTLIANAGGTIDLDELDGDPVAGSIIDVTTPSSHLVVGGPLSDAFGGRMTIGSGNIALFTQEWMLAANTPFGQAVELNFDAGTGIGELAGAELNSQGTINVVSGTAQITAPLIVADGTVTVHADARLRLDEDSNFYPAADLVLATGRSELEVNAIVLIQQPVFNWDGNGQSVTTIGDGGNLIIHSPQIEDVSNDGFDGTLNIAGTLSVNSNGEWVHEGVMNLDAAQIRGTDKIVVGGPNDSNADVNVNSGWSVCFTSIDFADGADLTVRSGAGLNLIAETTISTGADIRLEGSLKNDAEGTLTLNGPVSFTGDGGFFSHGVLNVHDTLASEARLYLRGTVQIHDIGGSIEVRGGTRQEPNQVAGGTIHGPGRLFAESGRTLEGFGTINAPIDFAGDAELRAASGTLTLEGPIFDVGAIGTQDDDGILLVTNTWNTSVADEVSLRGGELAGATVTNDGTIRGFGRITTDQLHNNQLLVADGGVLIVDTNAAPDLDGLGGGIVSAIDGDLIVVDPVFDAHAGTVAVGEGRTITFQGGWSLASNGTLDLLGGTTIAQTATVDGGIAGLAGTVNVTGETRLQAEAWFWPDAEVSLPASDARLRFAGGARIAETADFSGLGQVVNEQTSTLTIEDGGNLQVELRNAGRLEIGASPGAITTREFRQEPTGSLEVELGGLMRGDEYDVLQVEGLAQFAGELDVALINEFEPSAGNQFDILDFAASRGQFDTLSLPTLLGDLRWDESALLTLGILSVQARFLDADFDRDGDVDGEDFLDWQLGFGIASGANKDDGDADNDGDVDGADFLVWQLQFGQVTGGSSQRAAIPESATLWLAAVLGCGLLRSRATRTKISLWGTPM